MSFDTISVIGLGYVGLPTAVMLASRKKKVIGVDHDQHVVDMVNKGNLYIAEPNLDEIFKTVVNNGFLRAVKSPEPADAFLIAVPTPLISSNSKSSIPKPDLSYIKSVSKALAKVLKTGDLVILESTSPVGTTEQMAEWLAEERDDLTFPQTHGESSDIRIAYCPERILPGLMMKELVENDRVIGGLTRSCSKAAIDLYKTFVNGMFSLTNARTAELTKLTENASRDVNIAFANELSVICEKLDVDVWKLIELANLHPRINILEPGPGVGGHCIAVDPWFIASSVPNESLIIQTARRINDTKPDFVINQVKSAVKNFHTQNSGPVTIACFGLAYKPDIDDLRESPALQIAIDLSSLEMSNLLIVEPNIEDLPASLGPHTELTTIDVALTRADVCVLLVDHKEFKLMDVHRLKGKFIVDSKGIWSK
ncbi:MAG: UDP-N-acetyl-D-mannosamine dehydrogenase [Rickettsiales bacterium]|nr:UDP-N-acetyl-D-mannosamine dehydrogenase [Rickettsiales bacterium]